jgi:hypothetical protein
MVRRPHEVFNHLVAFIVRRNVLANPFALAISPGCKGVDLEFAASRPADRGFHDWEFASVAFPHLFLDPFKRPFSASTMVKFPAA